MKKVLLSAYACSPIRGSEENNGWSWAIGLAYKGFEVWCLTNRQDHKEKEAERSRLGLENLHFIFINLPFNFDVSLLKPSSRRIYLHYFLWNKKAKKKALLLHEKHKFNVAHHVSYGSFQQGSCLYKLKDCKIIFGPVGGGQMALPIFKPYFGSSWNTEVLREQVSKVFLKFNGSFRKTIRRADTVLTINQETEDLLRKTGLFKGRSDMLIDAAIPLSYEEMEFIEKPDRKELNILWIGRLIPRKGINLSLKALAYLPKDLDYKLNIVGGGEQESRIDAWIEEFGLDSSKINRPGRIPFSEVASEYRKADMMLFCSLRDTAGNQVMEAMAYGLPVVVLNISGMVNMVPEGCGMKVTPTTTEGTAQDIAKAIEEMYTNKEFRKKASRNAYDHAMKTTWKNKIEYVTSKYY